MQIWNIERNEQSGQQNQRATIILSGPKTLKPYPRREQQSVKLQLQHEYIYKKNQTK